MRYAWLFLAILAFAASGCDTKARFVDYFEGDAGAEAHGDPDADRPLVERSEELCPGGEEMASVSSGGLVDDEQAGGLVVSSLSIPGGYAYLPNFGEGTVSKLDTGRRVELGRYALSGSPREVAVGPGGDGHVITQEGVVTRIVGDRRRCEDRNGDGLIQTSTSGDVVLPFGDDECVLWAVDLGDRLQLSAVTIDESDVLWVGGEAIDGEGLFVGLDRRDGTVVEEITVARRPFTAMAGPGSLMWYTSHDGVGALHAVDTVTTAVLPDAGSTVCTDFAGLTVDADGRLWSSCPLPSGGRLARYDIVSANWLGVGELTGTTRGVTATVDGVWTASTEGPLEPSGASTLTMVDLTSGEILRELTLEGCDGAVGVSQDHAGNLWVPCHGSDAVAVVDPTSGESELIAVGSQPHAHSGFVSARVVDRPEPEGWYRFVLDRSNVCGEDNTGLWDRLEVDSDVPDGTALSLSVRTSDREELISAIPWLTIEVDDSSLYDITAAFDALGMYQGLRFMEVRLELESLDHETSPVLRCIEITARCR